MNGKRSRAPRGEPSRADEELLAAIARGDVSALGELYDRYAQDVWRAAHRILAGSGDAEDVVHTVFMKLPEIAASYDGRSNARPWLVGIAAHVAWRQRRGNGRFFRMLESFASTASSAVDLNPEREASAREDVLQFERSLAALSPSKRIVFILVEIEGLTSEEVGRALLLPAATVRTRLHHARRELDKLMSMKEHRGENED